jgi:hypothetical protein
MLYWVYLKLFYLKNAIRDVFCPIRSSENIRKQKVPWLWVGAEVSPGYFLSVTDVVNANVECGTIVDSDFLESITSLNDVISWRFLNAETLKEEEFPLTGIVIQE